MKRKFLAIFLTMIMVISQMILPSFADEQIQSDEMKLLVDLEILNNEKVSVEPVTRGDFTVATVALLGIKVYSGENYFSDITDNAGPINTAASIGIIKGTGDGLFMPDATITFDQAVKILVAALGYEVKTNYDFPSGYLSVAAQIGLLKGVSSESKFTWVTAAKLIYNAAHTDIFQSDLNGGYKTVAGETPLTKWNNIEIITGKVEANEYAFVTGNSTTGKDFVKIAGVTVRDSKRKATEYLGYTISAYCYDDEIKAVYHKGMSNIVTIMSDDIISNECSLNSIKYYENEKLQECNLERNATFIYNGKNEPADIALLPKDGKIVLIDTKGNKNADIVKIYDTETFIVDRVNVNTRKIFLKNGKGTLTLDEECDIIGYDGIMDISEVYENNVITVTRNKDEKIITVEVSGVSVKSKIVEKSDDSVTFENGMTYRVVDKDLLSTIEIGALTNVYIDVYDRIVGSSQANIAGMHYGYLIDAACKTRMGGYEGEMRIFNTTNGKIENYKIAEKTSVNDMYVDLYGRKLTANRVIERFHKNGVLKSQLIKFQLNSSGEIFKLYKAVDNTAEPFVYVDDFSLDFSYPTLNKGGTNYDNLVYNPGSNIINNDINLTKSVCIEIPELESGDKMIDYEDEIKIVSPTSKWVDPQHRLTSFEAYDLDENKSASVIIRPVAKGSDDKSYHNRLLFVDSVAEAINNEGIQVKKIYGYQAGQYVSFEIDPDSDLNRGNFDFTCGDVLRISLNNDKISNIIKIYTPTKKDGFLIRGNVSDDYVMRLGSSVYEKTTQPYWEENSIVLHVKASKVADEYLFVDVTPNIKNKLFTLSAANIVVYDEEKKELRPGSVMDIEPDNACQSVFMGIIYSYAYDVCVINRENPTELIWEGRY